VWMSQTDWTLSLVLAAARIGGIFMIAPVFASPTVPKRLRLGMCLVLALPFASMSPPSASPTSLPDLLLRLGGEVAMGALLGYAVAALLSGVRLGTFHIAQHMGLSLAEVFRQGPLETSGVLQRFFHMLTITVFLLIGGHRGLIWALRKTFVVLPLSRPLGSEGLVEMLVGVLASSFVLALKVAAPVLAALLVATAALGLLQRTLPQMNTLSIGLPARALLGLLVLAGCLVGFGELLDIAVDALFVHLETYLATLG
jgi:flagellar biosynthesis protein FliR